MLQVDVAAQVRNTFGKGAARTLRSAGLTPAVLYGPKTEPMALEVDTRGFTRTLLDIQRRPAVVTLHIVLDIAKRLAKKIRKEIGCEVIMTRTTDRYLTLEERTAIANTKDADLFISIQTNSARQRSAHGIETFFLNLATDDDAILVAARENATSKKNISDLQTILSDLMQNAKINESSRLAGMVQGSLHGHMKKRYSRVKNKGVKQAPFYVLLGAQMPAILVETSFISNPRECRRLTNSKYKNHLTEGILDGTQKYIRETSPSARFNPRDTGRKKG